MRYRPTKVLSVETVFSQLNEDVIHKQFIGIVRVSQPFQEESLWDQSKLLFRRARELGSEVVQIYPWIGSGKNPEWLRRAAEDAERLGVPLLGESVCRFIRSREYGPQNQSSLLDAVDLRKLVNVTGERMELITIHQPTAGSSRTHQTKRGIVQIERPEPVKRAGHRKWMRETYAPLAVSLFRKGVRKREIAEIVAKESGFAISVMSIIRWLQKAEQGLLSSASGKSEESESKEGEKNTEN